MKYIVTGCAGFIGMHVSKKILQNGDQVLGIDSLNNYYSVKLKKDRLSLLKKFKNFKFQKLDISNKKIIKTIKKYNPNKIINLAAYAGVRHSIKKPHDYIKANVIGFLNILEGCRYSDCKHLIYASSSSVYGLNNKKVFSENQQCVTPLSLYGASKLSNEHMAHAYSYLFNLETTGLRFFTVYGPWGRPDMALYIFAEAIKKKKKLPLFNYGNMKRDFTFVDDITNSIAKIIYRKKKTNLNKKFKIYNIGKGETVKLINFIKEIEKNLNKKAKIKNLPMQLGDIKYSNANVKKLNSDYAIKPKINYKTGIKKFIDWYLRYSK